MDQRSSTVPRLEWREHGTAAAILADYEIELPEGLDCSDAELDPLASGGGVVTCRVDGKRAPTGYVLDGRGGMAEVPMRAHAVAPDGRSWASLDPTGKLVTITGADGTRLRTVSVPRSTKLTWKGGFVTAIRQAKGMKVAAVIDPETGAWSERHTPSA